MKLGLALVAAVSGMEGHGRTDFDNVHIGGGAFDPGTTEALALWAIRKCKKKVCAVWPWAQCPLNSISEIKDGRTTRGPCCHKCWNKCPPYLARHREIDHAVFSNGEKRRFIKDEVWEFLENDIECETSRLKSEFMEEENTGYDMETIHGENGVAHVIFQDNDNFMANDMMLHDDPGLFEVVEVDEEALQAEREEKRKRCANKDGWYQCHGHKHAHCCKPGCLNNPDKISGKCHTCTAPLFGKAQGEQGCQGKCDYREDIIATMRKANDDECEKLLREN